jgi:hypothetical protein
MKTVRDIPKQRTPLVVIDRSLDKLIDKISFPEKLEKANKMLANAKIPVKR